MTDERTMRRNRRLGPPPPSARSPSTGVVEALLAQETILGLLLLGLALAVMLAASPGQQGNALSFFGLAALLVTWVTSLSLGVIHLFRRGLGKLATVHLLGALILIVLAVTLASGVVGWVIVTPPDTPPERMHEFLARISAVALSMSGAGALIATAAARWRRSRTELAKAELKHLQARVRPHFLFNALNTAAAFLPGRPKEAEEVLLNLADLFRAALRDAQTHTLPEEIELTRRYLQIEKQRLGERLVIEWDSPDALPEIEVPTFCLQALAENAIHHGIEPSRQPGTVHIRITLEAGTVRASITNPLPHPDSASSRTGGERIGIRGTRARLTALMGEEATLVIGPEDGGFTARLSLPVHATTR